MRITYIHGVAALSLLVSTPAFAQTNGQQVPNAAMPTSSTSPAMCAQSSQAVTRGIDALVGRIDEARQTNDAAKMRAMVGDLQVTLAQMKGQLADCTALTEGSGTAMDHSKMQTPAQSGAAAPATKPAAPMAGMDQSKMNAEKAQAAAGSTPSKPATVPTVLFSLRTQPAPPRNGKNDFEVTLKDDGGKPIADAEVLLEFSMLAMPSMKMPDVKLTSVGNGSYKGGATLGMAGDWDVTVKASRNGQQLAVKRMRLTAK